MPCLAQVDLAMRRPLILASLLCALSGPALASADDEEILSLKGYQPAGLQLGELGAAGAKCGLDEGSLQGAVVRAMNEGGVKGWEGGRDGLYVDILVEPIAGGRCVAAVTVKANGFLLNPASDALIQTTRWSDTMLVIWPGGGGAPVQAALTRIIERFSDVWRQANAAPASSKAR
jgi:hypothetical protein